MISFIKATQWRLVLLCSSPGKILKLSSCGSFMCPWSASISAFRFLDCSDFLGLLVHTTHAVKRCKGLCVGLLLVLLLLLLLFSYSNGVVAFPFAFSSAAPYSSLSPARSLWIDGDKIQKDTEPLIPLWMWMFCFCYFCCSHSLHFQLSLDRRSSNVMLQQDFAMMMADSSGSVASSGDNNEVQLGCGLYYQTHLCCYYWVPCYRLKTGSRKWAPRFDYILDQLAYTAVENGVAVNEDLISEFENHRVHQAVEEWCTGYQSLRRDIH